ncbi:alcohol dehydrogenase catalytic domain-containing protein [Oscillochloris sp. ZM17-4]|uniref:alcohol dehydrogenase catalytic domain-containing protein n=1 Tax=Oscillochloris sp. ZM17-4 TaxID=2866714 RepID=UPI001C72AE7F|nr:alcohol dehydrogenase catalytic domain-containing protein [Oscillochloris sp. ZM17-4]MBX0330971.1 alcohol dehydrogenase catalytic domain-containing protein [Oscillochloris sp. ZM17-4]
MSRSETYRSLGAPAPASCLAWNMYGPGVEQIGRAGAPEQVPVAEPGPGQLLVRVDAVGMCFSDVKLIQQGGKHPKLYNRDLANDPTRLGHEVSMTIVRVGEQLRGQFAPGQRFAIQPDIYVGGRSTAYGYTIPGGLIQYHLVGPEVLAADDGAYVLPVDDRMGYAETALTEPWACVEAAYTQRRRLEPLPGGTMWIVGRPGDLAEYSFSAGLDAPATIVLTDAPPSMAALVAATGASVVVRDGVGPEGYATLRDELTGGRGFDDIVLLDPRSAEAVGAAARLAARRGTVAMVGGTPLDGPAQIDLGRIHYDYIAYLGTGGPDIAAAYGAARNRCELRPGGLAVFVGAGGPMGQMHVQRAIELPHGPATIIATDLSDARLEAIARRFTPLAEANDRRLLLINPAREGAGSLEALVSQESGGAGADDVVVSVPAAGLMADSARLLGPDGMLVLFAGVPNGSLAPLDLSNVYLRNAQLTGTSGSALADQAHVIAKTVAGELSPNRSVAAVGGIEAAREGVAAMMEGRYPGKVVIFPQLSGLPLQSVEELAAGHPAIAAALGPDGSWSAEAERALIEEFWRP